jgi:hypothetical protein
LITIARALKIPVVPVLHILNGDSTRFGLERSGVPGEFLAWTDVLYEGPVTADSGTDAFRRARAKYLSSAGYGRHEAILRDLRHQDQPLDRCSDYDEIVLWFEHDLFDQLLLIRHLDWLSRNPGAASRVQLIQSDRYLGPMHADELAALYPGRAAVTPLQVASGTDAWRAVCADSPAALERLVSHGPQPELPYLHGALSRLVEEYPSTSCGLSRSERQILRALNEGSGTLESCFVSTQQMEDRIFMGDASFLHIARGLASARDPLIHFEDGWDGSAWRRASVDLTDTGGHVLAGEADHTRVNGIDRWIGGVHLHGKDVRWRWDDRI